MASWKGRPWIEVFKFCTYISIPITMTIAFAMDPGNLEWVIKNRAYVTYPPEAKRPPTGDEFWELKKKVDDQVQRNESQGIISGWFGKK